MQTRRIVKISDLNDKEKEQLVIERKAEQLNLSNKAKEETQNANNLFDNLYKRKNLKSKENMKDNAKFLVTKTIPIGIKGAVADNIDSVAIDTSANLQKGANSKNKINDATQNLINIISGLVNPMNVANNQMKNLGVFTANVLKGENIKAKAKEYINNNLTNLNPIDNINKESTQLLGTSLGKENTEKITDKALHLTDWYQKDREEYAKELETKGDMTKLLGNVAENTTRMLPSMAISIITKNPDLALMSMYHTAKGGASREALNNGASLDDAQLVGRAKGLVEVATEKMTGGLKFAGKGNLDDLVENGIKEKVKNNVAKKILTEIYHVGGEIAEEEVSDIAGTLVDRAVYDPDATMPSLKDMGETAKVTALSTILLNAIGVPVNRVMSRNVQNTNQNTQEIQNNPIVPINKNNVETSEISAPIEKYNAINSSKSPIPPMANKPTIESSTLIQYNSNRSNKINAQQHNNEGVGGIDGQIQRRGVLEDNGDSSWLYEKSQFEQIGTDKRQEYKNWERTIRPIRKENLTTGQRNKIENIKRQYNKDIVFFSGKDTDLYSGGASYNEKNKVYIDLEQVQNYGEDKMIYHEIAESDILHNKEVYSETIRPSVEKIMEDKNFENQKREFWKEQQGDMPNDYLIAKDIICDRFAELKTGEKLDYNNVLSQETNMNIDFALKNFYKSIYGKDLTKESMTNNMISSEEIVPQINKKTINLNEISNLKPEDANTTPNLSNKKYEKGSKQSSFYSNIVTDSKFLSEDFRKAMSQDKNIKYYKEITNKDTLEKAYKELQDGGEKDVIGWFSKNGKDADATDVSKGWILLKEYQDNGDFEDAVRVAKKMRDIATTAGQTIQAFNIMSRLTPEGMTMYAQSELTEAYNKMVKGKTQKWVDENYSKFELSPSETAFIIDTMEQVATMEDGYDKKVKLAEIQKVITDKVPPTAGQSIKSWMRISMLFNPKTQIRNIGGNAIILPLNTFSDMFASVVDRQIAKKTGIRTTGNINLKSYAKGFGKGIYESYNDFRKGIDTRNIQGNRFEVNEGKNFKDKGIGKALNRVDNMLSFMLDAGDRGFYEASFNNSINNQMILNNSTEITQEMIDIATNEALQRTWQDNNEYTKSVLKIRKILNKINVKGYGAGDVLIPFAKTPANLTKAIVDYSPIGLTRTLAYDAKKLMNAIKTNQYTPQMQHNFVQNLGKGFSGSFLYVLGYALAKAGIITGEADDDKDVKNFMKNSLGISSYSIKIGNKTFTYDWAQPIAAPFAIMANYVQKKEMNPNASMIEKAINVIGTGFDLLLEQSFMESINSLFNGSGSTVENIQKAVLELPARAIPTFSKQIADMVDSTQRTVFEYDKPIKSAINSMVTKIPVASKTLAPVRDTLGNEVKKYGGYNNVFNVFINPANTNKGELSKAGEEIYKVYQETGETRIFPITAPYYINSNGDKVTMDSKQRTEYQKVAGTYVENTLDGLLNNSTYKKLTTSKKVELIAEIVNDSNARAKYKVLNIESKEATKKRNFIDKVQPQNYYDYKIKTKNLDTSKKKNKVLADSSYSNSIKSIIYEETTGKSDELYQILKKDKININEYLKYKEQEFESDTKDDGTTSGKSISGSKKKKVYNYVNNMKITYKQRLLLLGTQYKLGAKERKDLANYINSLTLTKNEKLKICENLKGFTVYKNGTVSW